MKDIEHVTRLFEMLSLNFSRSPWSRMQGPYGWIRLLRREIDELEEALKSGDMAHIKEELGDVLWTSLTLALSFKRLVPSGLFLEVVSGSIAKMRQRKPWVFDGSDITFTAEEEHALFRANKAAAKEEAHE
jgi:NTP pyrophosphatase (non-canonical NTP hydrolase)